jgi:hemin uptake protein HemP
MQEPMHMNKTPKSDHSTARPDERASGDERKQFDVRDLLGDAREAVLIHGGEEYRLRITANGKLILTK